MAIQKQIVDVALAGKLDTKSNKKMVPTGGVLESRNADFEETGAIKHRMGFSQFESSTTTAFPIEFYGVDLLVPSAESLLLQSPSAVEGSFIYSQHRSRWEPLLESSSTANIKKARTLNATPESHSRISWDYNETRGIEAYVSDVDPDNTETLVTSGTFNLKIRDIISGREKSIASSNGVGPKCTILQSTNRVLLARYDNASTDIAVTVYDLDGSVVGSFSFIGTTLGAASHINSSNDYEIYNDGSYVFVVNVRDNTLTDVDICYYDIANNTFNLLKSRTGLGTYVGTGIDIVPESPTYLFYAYPISGGIQIDRVEYPGAGASQFAGTITTSVGTPRKLSLVPTSSASVDCFYEYQASTPTRTNVGRVDISYTGPIARVGSDVLWKHISLSSKVVKTEEIFGSTDIENWTFIASHGTENGRIDYLVSYCPNLTDSDSGDRLQVLARFNYITGRGYDDFDTTVIRPVWDDTNKILRYGGKFISRVLGNSKDPQDLIYQTGIKAFDFYMDDNRSKSIASLTDNTYISGGFIQEFDGTKIFENGFHYFPEVGENSQDTGGTPVVADGEYQYKAIYEYTDARGNLSRSQSSNSLTVTVSGGPKRVTLDLLPLGLGVKPNSLVSDGEPCKIAIYRKDPDSSNFKRLGVVGNAINENNLTYLDNTASTEGLEVLYDDTALPNDPGPACHFLYAAKDRLWFISGENRQKYGYSKPKFEDECANFSDFLTLTYNTERNEFNRDLEGLAELDDKILLFKENATAYFYGDPANEVGTQSTLTPPIAITSEKGCIHNKTIVTNVLGVMFLTSRGIYLIDRGLSFKYVGAGIEGEIDDNVEGAKTQFANAISVPDRNVTIFYEYSGGESYAYNYLTDNWSVYDDGTYGNEIYGKDIAIFQDNAILINNSNEVYEQKGTDAESLAALKVATPWIKLGSLHGYQRVQRLILELENVTVSIRVNIYINYDDTTVVQTKDIDPLPIDTVPKFSQIHLEYQKCTAMKVEIEEITQQTDDTVGFAMTGLSLMLGMKKGFKKLPDSRSF